MRRVCAPPLIHRCLPVVLYRLASPITRILSAQKIALKVRPSWAYPENLNCDLPHPFSAFLNTTL